MKPSGSNPPIPTPITPNVRSQPPDEEFVSSLAPQTTNPIWRKAMTASRTLGHRVAAAASIHDIPFALENTTLTMTLIAPTPMTASSAPSIAPVHVAESATGTKARMLASLSALLDEPGAHRRRLIAAMVWRSGDVADIDARIIFSSSERVDGGGWRTKLIHGRPLVTGLSLEIAGRHRNMSS